MSLSFLADEHVKRVFVTELRANGYDVAWIDSGYAMGTTDAEHLRRSAASGRVIVTNDADFLRQHHDYDHGGILIYDDQNLSVTEFVRAIRRIDRHLTEPDLAGDVVWLDGWIE